MEFVLRTENNITEHVVIGADTLDCTLSYSFCLILTFTAVASDMYFNMHLFLEIKLKSYSVLTLGSI